MHTLGGPRLGMLDLHFTRAAMENVAVYRCIVTFYDSDYTAEFEPKIYRRLPLPSSPDWRGE